MTKNFFKIVSVVFMCAASYAARAQETQTPPVKSRHFTFYAGVGPNFYFNNLVLAKDYVKEYNYSIVGRIMWEPEHYLGLGIESGYYQLYHMDVTTPNNPNVHIVNVAIPIQIVVSMKFFENFYCNFNMGQSILKNLVSTTNLGEFNASTVSLGDFAASIGYRRPVLERFYLGTEVKGFYSAKLQDRNIALVFLGGFRF